MKNFKEKANFIWNIANVLRGPYKPENYGNVILPLSVIRRFDCLLEPTKEKVLDMAEKTELEEILNNEAGFKFHNKSKYDFKKLLDDSTNIAANLRNYINGFSKNIREIIEHFDFDKEIDKLNKNNLLYLIIKEFNKIDLHPDKVSNQEMGYIFEELIRKFSENAEAGDHYTPREVIRLMVNILMGTDNSEIKDSDIITVGDFAAGTGGMLSEAKEYIKRHNSKTPVKVFGQEINPQSYAICKADMLIKGEDSENIKLGNSLTKDDQHPNLKVRYGLMNPPFGVSWGQYSKDIEKEREKKGFNGRYGAGTPTKRDGSLLFLQHLISKMKKDEKGSRIAIIFSGSPLFSGSATDGGESEIRRWIIENDWLEGIIGLPENLFYNAEISTYIWILSNRKNENPANGPIRKNKVQLIDATSFYENMRKSMGEKRHKISNKQIKEITKLYSDFKENKYCRIFDKEEFGYLKVRIERPLQLNFKITEDRIENIYSENTFSKLFDEEKYNKLKKLSEAPKFKAKDKNKLEKLEKGKKLQEKILNRLREHVDQDKIWKNREEFNKILKNILGDLDLKKSLMKAVRNGLSKRDKTADYCKKRGKIESDTDLRDHERVPFSHKVKEYKQDYSDFVEKENDNITAYFEEEVKPHVTEAWVDYSYTRVGYEIPFTRFFYEFEELDPSHKIKEDIEELEAEINEIMQKVLG
jgi:type I restriction enzyme M protein